MFSAFGSDLYDFDVLGNITQHQMGNFPGSSHGATRYYGADSESASVSLITAANTQLSGTDHRLLKVDTLGWTYTAEHDTPPWSIILGGQRWLYGGVCYRGGSYYVGLDRPGSVGEFNGKGVVMKSNGQGFVDYYLLTLDVVAYLEDSFLTEMTFIGAPFIEVDHTGRWLFVAQGSVSTKIYRYDLLNRVQVASIETGGAPTAMHATSQGDLWVVSGFSLMRYSIPQERFTCQWTGSDFGAAGEPRGSAPPTGQRKDEKVLWTSGMGIFPNEQNVVWTNTSFDTYSELEHPSAFGLVEWDPTGNPNQFGYPRAEVMWGPPTSAGPAWPDCTVAPPTEVPHLRQRQRDDVIRQDAGPNHPTSRQKSNRQGHTNTYV